MRKHLDTRGDTIIEVLLAITVFSLVAVGTMTVMNKGTDSAQRALEITLVKEQIDAQAEALRAAQQDYAANKVGGQADTSVWASITSMITGKAESSDSSECPDYSGSSVFAMNAKTIDPVATNYLKSAGVEGAPPYAQVKYTHDLSDEEDPDSQTAVDGVYGLWIEKTDLGGTPAAYDFTIHACWYSVGTNVPMQLQTVVRLYDPAS